MYQITKQELIFVLDTVEELQQNADTDYASAEMVEVVTIVNGILDNPQVEID